MKSLRDTNSTIAPQVVQKYNNVIFVLDSSGSMNQHRATAFQVFQKFVDDVKNSHLSGIKTRISLYTFNNQVECQAFMAPSESFSRSSLQFWCSGQTALIDASYQAIMDHATRTTPLEDNTYLMYVITDGEENCSRHTSSQLQDLLAKLDDSWTLATMVPNLSASHYAKRVGFPAGNIEIWNANSAKGFEEVGRTLSSSYRNYNAVLLSGARSTSNLFRVDAKNVSKTEVKKNLQRDLNSALFEIDRSGQIRDVVEGITAKNYVPGQAFYELKKKEKVQSNKDIAIVSKTNGEIYTGQSARQMLGLPDYNCDVKPGDFGDWRIFVQSRSNNRKVLNGDSIIIKNIV